MDEASKANNKQASPSQDENGDDLPRERSKTEMIPNSGFKKRKGTEDSFGSDDDIEDSELERQRQEYLAQRGVILYNFSLIIE
jgi:Eukaryotic elongation factor 1 beta central acidic region.